MINAQTNTRRLLGSVTQSHFYEHFTKNGPKDCRRAVMDRFRLDRCVFGSGKEHLHENNGLGEP